MHATKLFIATMALSVFTLAYGQTYPGGQSQDVEKWVREIRQEYNLVKSRISTLEKDGYAGELFCLHAINNKYGKSYPAVGEYRAETFFYYELEANFPPRLRMVVETTVSAGNKAYFEALYNESGEVLFLFEQSSYDNNRAKRLYYSEGKIIRYSENNVEKRLDTMSDETLDEVIWTSRAATAQKTRFDLFYEAE
jgi:hypothetical protein